MKISFSKFAIAAAMVAAGSATAAHAELALEVTPAPALDVEKTYTVTIENNGTAMESNIALPDLFKNAVKLAAKPEAEYFVYRGEGDDATTALRMISMKTFLSAGEVSFPSLNSIDADQTNGLAVHPTNGQVYILTELNGSGDRCLYKIHLKNATSSSVGCTGDYFNSIAFDGNGKLWAVAASEHSDEDDIFSISLVDGSATKEFDGVDGDYPRSLAFNADNGLMYFFTDDELYTFSPAAASPSLSQVTDDVNGPNNESLEISVSTYIGNNTMIVQDDDSDFMFLDTVTGGAGFAALTTGGTEYWRGFVNTGADKPWLECTGSGDEMDCVVPKLIPGGKVVLTVTATIFEAPEPPAEDDEEVTDTTDDVTDTTDDVTDTTDELDEVLNEIAEDGGCTANPNAQAQNSSLLLFALFVGLFGITRLRKEDA